MLQEPSIVQYSHLLSSLYDGHIEEDPYSQFLDNIRRILELNFASMTLREPIGRDGGLLFISSENLEKTLIDNHDNPYTDRYYTSDLMTNLPWGKAITIDEIMPYSSFESSDLYTMCMKPIGIYHMAGMDLRNANGQRFTVRFCRPKNAENFSPEEKVFLTELGVHIQRAVANGMQLIQLDSERKLFSNTISGLSIGIVTLDERGKVINCNQSANRLIAERDGLNMVNNHLHLDSNRARKIFEDAIEDIITAKQKDHSPSVHALAADRPSGKADLEILIKPLTIDKSVESTQTPNLMVFISDPEKIYEIDIKILISLYRLTRAEAMLAKHLAAGNTLDQSSLKLGIARNTARAQLRSIFAKTGVTQQSMLVSLILKSLATLS